MPVVGLGHYFDPGNPGEEGPDPGANERAVIGEEDANGRHSAFASGSPAGIRLTPHVPAGSPTGRP